jgi:predicted RNA binding protein with dsRBD fold (UPF0201 family)
MSSAAIVSRPDAALGEGDVLGDARVEVVADHQHVEMLVDRVRPCTGRVGLVEEGRTFGSPHDA